MKKSLTILTLLPMLLIFMACASTNNSVTSSGNVHNNGVSTSDTPNSYSLEDGTLVTEYESGTEYSYEDGFNHNIPYENGTIRINDISFTEKKAGAYYEAHAEVIIGLSELSNDEYQWFMDEYRDQSDHSVLTGEIETVFYVMVDDELERMNLVSMEKNTGKNKELILQYQFDEYKRSIDGNDAIFQFDFEKPESFRFEDKDGKVSFLNKSDKYIFNFTVSLMD